jgi:hypothetical protein
MDREALLPLPFGEITQSESSIRFQVVMKAGDDPVTLSS